MPTPLTWRELPPYILGFRTPPEAPQWPQACVAVVEPCPVKLRVSGRECLLLVHARQSNEPSRILYDSPGLAKLAAERELRETERK